MLRAHAEAFLHEARWLKQGAARPATSGDAASVKEPAWYEGLEAEALMGEARALLAAR